MIHQKTSVSYVSSAVSHVGQASQVQSVPRAGPSGVEPVCLCAKEGARWVDRQTDAPWTEPDGALQARLAISIPLFLLISYSKAG